MTKPRAITDKLSTKDIVYAFIDSQNLNFGTSKDLYKANGERVYVGWKLDFRKFRKWLKDKYKVKKAFLFIGYTKDNESLYTALKDYGYELVYKQTVKDSFGKLKGNIDAELVLYAAKIEFENYTKAIITSGDGDFACLHKHLREENKLYKIIIPNAKSASSLLNEFHSYKDYVAFAKDKLEYTGTKNGRRHT